MKTRPALASLLLLAAPVLLLLPTRPASGMTDTGIAARQARLLHLERDYNTYRRVRPRKAPKPGKEQRLRNQFPEEDKLPKPIALFRVKADEATTAVISEFASDTMKAAITAAPGVYFIPVLPEEESKMRRFTRRFGPPVMTQAYKMLGRSSYWIPATAPGARPVIAKFEKPALVRPAVFINDQMVRASRASGLDPELVNEFAGFAFSEEKLGYHAVVFRSTDAILDASAENEVVPGHGLLGNDALVEDVAGRQSMLPEHWEIHAWAPWLARKSAEDHFARFAIFENHTQNILPELNRSSGELKRLYRKDLADVVLDLVLAVTHGVYDDRARVRPPRLERLNQVSVHFFEPHVAYAKNTGLNMAIYTEQSLTARTRSFKQVKALTLQFIDSYREAVEGRVGFTFVPSARYLELRKAIEESKKTDELADNVENAVLNAQEAVRKNPRVNALAAMIQEIYDAGRAELLQASHYSDAQLAPVPSVERARLTFVDAVRDGESVSYVDAETKARLESAAKSSSAFADLEFRTRNGYLIAIRDGRIVAVTIKSMKKRK